MESKKNPDEMDFWELSMYNATRFLPGAFCGKCGSQLEPSSILDDVDKIGFSVIQLELVWVTYRKCCSIEDPMGLHSWDAMVSAFCKSLFGDRYL